jgi:hypothetical protein
MKNFGVKCAFVWKNDKGKIVGIEERVLLIKAKSAHDAFLRVEKETAKEKPKKGGWTIKLVKEKMESFELFEIENPKFVEVYSSVHRNRRSVKRTLNGWFCNDRG